MGIILTASINRDCISHYELVVLFFGGEKGQKREKDAGGLDPWGKGGWGLRLTFSHGTLLLTCVFFSLLCLI